MRTKATSFHAVYVFLILAGAILALSPTPVVAYPGGCHKWAAEAAGGLFGVWRNHQGIDPMEIDRDRPAPLLPELEMGTEWYNPDYGCCDDEDRELRANWDWLRTAAMAMDVYDDQTRHHFWSPIWGLHHVVNNTAGMNNAWESVHEHWVGAIDAWQLGNLGEAYTELGYAMHFVEDGGQPAHANDDMHPGDALSDDDSLEDWISGEYCEANFNWNIEDLSAWPGPILYPPHDNAAILNQILNANGGCWDGDCDYPIEPDSGGWAEQDQYLFNLSYPYSVYNQQQFFYIMYYVNQMGNYFASDSEDGNVWEPIGWLNNYARISPTPVLRCPDCEGGWTYAQDSDGLNPDNDGYECTDDDDNDRDGDLSMIAHWAYGASFAGMPAMLDLFRRTVDAVPPVSTVDTTRTDGQPMHEWNNVPVMVQITGATDYGNPYLRAAGVYKRWGKVDGVTPSFMPNADQTPYWIIGGDGEHQVRLLSIDTIGNVETGENDYTVKVDQTPPQVTFPDLRPNYLTSQTFTATWNAWDATSGVASEVAYLDGNLVSKGQVFDLAQMAGLHSLRVIVYDNAENYTDVAYGFEVWIDANGWCLPVYVNSKTQGDGLTCVVEFPQFYNVGLISLNTTTFAVKGWVDLHEQDPVLGQTANLPGLLLTGVGDHDGDRVRDRKTKFDKALFVQALNGQTGDVSSVIRGGLLPNGLPHFLAPVVVPVFKSPK
jgi:hypothetical protein